MIKIKNLKKQYNDFCLDIDEFCVASGNITGIVGRNGSGKTTTIKSILGLVKPNSGEVLTLGKVASKLDNSDRKKIAVVLSDSGFSGYLSIKDIAAIMRNMYENFDEKWFIDNCRQSSLPLDKQIKEFSTGMAVKLKLLIGCSYNADLLVLDEPTSGLDVIARNEILDMLRNYMAEKPERSMLVSSHISSDLENLCDDIYMISKGKVVLHEDTDRIVDDYGVLHLTLQQYESIDKQYILVSKKEKFGYSCFTNQKQYYKENYPDVVIENGGIDEMIIMMN